MKTIITSACILVSSSLLFSCKKGNYERDFMPPKVVVVPNAPKDTCTTDISYSKQAKSIFASKCATSGCHDAGNQNPDLTVYQNIFDNKGTIRNRINDTGNPMPPSGNTALTSCELSKLNAWINAGAPNN